MMKHIFMTIIVTLLLAGCSRPADPSRFYGGPLSAEDLVGCWVITEDSLPYLKELQFAKYTNRLDHILLLNRDGSCVYRTFDRFTPDWSGKTKETEEARYNRFAKATLRSSRSWYRWNPNGDPIISGPYSSTNDTATAPGVLLKNCWDLWRLADSGENVRKQFEIEDPLGGNMFRYKIEFDNHEITTDLFWFICKQNDRLFLWQPKVMRPGDGAWAQRDMVCFEKVDIAQLAK